VYHVTPAGADPCSVGSAISRRDLWKLTLTLAERGIQLSWGNNKGREQVTPDSLFDFAAFPGEELRGAKTSASGSCAPRRQRGRHELAATRTRKIGRSKTSAGGDTSVLGIGQMVRCESLENVQKRGDFGGLWAGKGGSKGHIGDLKRCKKGAFWASRRGKYLAQRGFRPRIGHYVTISARPESTSGTMRSVRRMREKIDQPFSRS
jgi:hypothetical protein